MSLGLFGQKDSDTSFGDAKPPEVNHPRRLTITVDDHRPSHLILIGSRPLTFNNPETVGT